MILTAHLYFFILKIEDNGNVLHHIALQPKPISDALPRAVIGFSLFTRRKMQQQFDAFHRHFSSPFMTGVDRYVNCMFPSTVKDSGTFLFHKFLAINQV